MFQATSLRILLFELSILLADSAKLLSYYPSPFLSHQSAFYPVTNELLRRGHEITVITPNPQYTNGKRPENLTEIDVNQVSYSVKDEFIQKYVSAMEKDNNGNTQYYLVSSMLIAVVEQQMLEPQVQNILTMDRNNFDLIIVEACARATIIISHYHNAPIVEISSFGALTFNLETIGAPTHYLLYSPMSKRLHNLSFWEKVKELHMHAELHVTSLMMNNIVNQMYRKRFGPNVPSIAQLRTNIHMLSINLNPMWAGNLPAPPALIYTGGNHFRPQNKLPKDLKSYLDGSRYGVIYISFGTNVYPSQITREVRQKFVNVLSKLPYDVLLKWDQDEFSEQSTNIKISKWLPQAELLGHSKVILFITQGGLQSTDEAIEAGVPVIGVPLVADQWYNVEKYIYFEIGMKIDITNFTEEGLREAIITVIGNESYRQNMQKLCKIMYDQPQTPLERVVWWLQYVIRHGGARHLRAPAANISWTEYYELELVCITVAITLLVAYITVKTAKYLCRQAVKLSKIFKVKTT